MGQGEEDLRVEKLRKLHWRPVREIPSRTEKGQQEEVELVVGRVMDGPGSPSLWVAKKKKQCV
jgi:hypothetical protein